MYPLISGDPLEKGGSAAQAAQHTYRPVVGIRVDQQGQALRQRSIKFAVGEVVH